MRVLVTGGAGFIGSNLVDALVARGERVVVVDDLSTGRRENLAGALDRGVELIEGDIADPKVVAEAFAAAQPETVAHLAAQIDVRRSVAEPVFDLGVNVGGTLNLLEHARESGVARFVLASTGGAIYGEGAGRELPLDESAACLPEAPYGQSKLAAEGYVSLYGRLHGLSGISLRFANVYGPRQDPHGEAGVVAIFTGALLGGARPRVFGDGRQTRDYVYVGDVVEAVLAALDSSVEGVFNIGTGIETDVLDLGARLASACGVEFDPEMAPARAGEARRISISSELAARELGWRARADLDRGLAQTVESIRANEAVS
ncbi:MAG TPA: NAD-dependent epimerase/dehydratase family protein [Solirubrobacterales bacterium]|nr:NAD-dependent epimerase/dehydratase family protein [Solirubrobacterales bacterium]